MTVLGLEKNNCKNKTQNYFITFIHHLGCQNVHFNCTVLTFCTQSALGVNVKVGVQFMMTYDATGGDRIILQDFLCNTFLCFYLSRVMLRKQVRRLVLLQEVWRMLPAARRIPHLLQVGHAYSHIYTVYFLIYCYFLFLITLGEYMTGFLIRNSQSVSIIIY